MRASVSGLNATGYWAAPLPQTSHPYKGEPKKGEPAKGDSAGKYAGTHVGDEFDTSPFTDSARTPSISTAEYLRNMNILIQSLDQEKPSN